MSRSPAFTTFILATALLLAATSPGLAQDSGTAMKIAVVDLDRVIFLSPLGKGMQDQLKKLEDNTKSQLQELAARAQEVRQQATAAGLSQEQLLELQNQLEDHNVAGRRIRAEAERQAKKIQDEGLSKIQEQLRPVFEKLRADAGYDLILNNTPGVVILAGPTVDITDQVLQYLANQGSGGE